MAGNMSDICPSLYILLSHCLSFKIHSFRESRCLGLSRRHLSSLPHLRIFFHLLFLLLFLVFLFTNKVVRLFARWDSSSVSVQSSKCRTSQVSVAQLVVTLHHVIFFWQWEQNKCFVLISSIFMKKLQIMFFAQLLKMTKRDYVMTEVLRSLNRWPYFKKCSWYNQHCKLLTL